MALTAAHSIGDPGHVADHNLIDTAISSLQADVSALQSAPSGGAGLQGVIYADSYSGTDDQKLAAAMSAAAAATYKPMILLSPRNWAFSTPIVPFRGFQLSGSHWGGNDEPLTGNPYPTKVTLNGMGTTPWIQWPSGTIRSCYIGNLSFQGDGTNTQWLSAPSSGIWWSRFENLSWSGFKYVWGSNASQCLMTGVWVYGWQNINNPAAGSECSVNIAGSDNNLWMDGLFIDGSGQGTSPSGKYHMKLSLEKCTIGPLYMTCRGQSGLLLQGGASSDGNTTFMPGSRFEGYRQNSQQCKGAFVRQTGGGYSFFGAWFGYGLSDPTNGSNSGDLGYIHVTGGTSYINGCTFAKGYKADGTTPLSESTDYMVYNAGGFVTVRDMIKGNGSTDQVAWSGKPKVVNSSGTLVLDGWTANSAATSVYQSGTF